MRAYDLVVHAKPGAKNCATSESNPEKAGRVDADAESEGRQRP